MAKTVKDVSEIKYLLLKCKSVNPMFTATYFLGEWVSDSKEVWVVKYPIRVLEIAEQKQVGQMVQMNLLTNYVADDFLSTMEKAEFSKDAFEASGLLNANDLTQRDHVTKYEKALEAVRLRKSGLVHPSAGVSKLSQPNINQ